MMEQRKFGRAESPTGFKLVLTRDLHSSDVPPDSSIWAKLENSDEAEEAESLMAFALSFDACGLLDDAAIELSEFVDRCLERGRLEILDCFNTTGLRVLLFVQQRKWGKRDSGGSETDQLTRAIIKQLASRI